MKTLILDFDGTIVQSGPLIYANLVEYTRKPGYTWEDLRKLPSSEVVKTLGICKLDLPEIILKIRADFKSKLAKQPIVPGMKEALTTLRETDHSLHIVSSNSAENISEFLRIHGLKEAMSDVTSFFTIFGKAHGLMKLIAKLRCDRSDTVYIGDETRDIKAAQKAGIRSIAVTWGYNTEGVLATYQPDFMVREPHELVGLLCEGHT